MKATFDRYGEVVTGHIEDIEMYEDVKSGKKKWKDHVYNKITHIRIPKEVFEKLLELDRKDDVVMIVDDNEWRVIQKQATAIEKRVNELKEATVI